MKQHAITSIANKRLIIVAHSARALAQSARRAGYEVIAVDGFADTDTQQACSACWHVPLTAGRFDSNKINACLQLLYKKYPQSHIVLGPGGEFYTSFIELNLPDWQVSGNTAETIQQVTQPALFFACLEQLQIPYPEISLSVDMPADGEWLRKSTQSCGGMGVLKVAHAEGLQARQYYWQRELTGVPISALVITDGQAYTIIGYNQQLVDGFSKQLPYVYSGAIANVSLDENNKIETNTYIRKLIDSFNLIGVFSLDMMLLDQTLVVLELNPRISSSYELYERIQPELNLVDAHIRVCECDALCEFAAMTGLAGQRIFYAKQDHKITNVTWPDWLSDRPNEEQSIAKNEPLCSVFASGDDMLAVQALLEKRVQQVPDILQQKNN